MPAASDFHVAIVGGGLCGLALAIALDKRSISYTIYESHASFTEIGAGINLGPNAIKALDLIDPSLCEAIYGLATRNKPDPNVWMNISLAATTDNFEAGTILGAIAAPPTGNMTFSRNELLLFLAKRIDPAKAEFNRKFKSYEETEHGVTLSFEDGTLQTASVVIGCDGIHSAVRRAVLGPDHPAARPEYSGAGGYRAVFTVDQVREYAGEALASSSSMQLAPGGYVIMYPIDGGRNFNVGLWKWREGDRTRMPWIVPDQKQEMLKDFGGCGQFINNIMDHMGDDTAFWAAYHHGTRPEQYYSGRVCLIGDGGHSMPPHQGQGATQSIEDAYVIAEVLEPISRAADATTAEVGAAFGAYEAVRKPRFEAVQQQSHDAFHVLSDWWRADLTREDLEAKYREIKSMFEWIWEVDLRADGSRARALAAVGM